MIEETRAAQDESPSKPMNNEPANEQPERISRWESLQRAKALGANHPDPVFRLSYKAIMEQEQKEKREQRENDQPWDYEIMI